MADKTAPLNIGGRVEMFIDRFLIADMDGAALKMTPPQPREKVLLMDRPWEGPGSGIYSCVFFDGEKYRYYYRGVGTGEKKAFDGSENQYNCLAVSSDGIHWEKPELGLVEFNGDTKNNIVFSGHLAHNFSPMLDPNPACPPDEKFKAVAGLSPNGLYAFKSPDGLRWSPIQKDPVIKKGAFDSHNLCFYDTNRGGYRCYSRYFARPDGEEALDPGAGVVISGRRAIQNCVSSDFRRWSEPVPNHYNEGAPLEQFYTNATVLCPGAEHIYLSFPMRFMSERYKNRDHQYVGVSDAVFMTSRDGEHFDRTFPEAWIRPDLSPRNWTQRNYITACGVLETSPEEFSLYVGEHYEWDDAFARRYTVRRHGFGSVNAPYAGGAFITKPFVFDGDTLHLNYSTSAPGGIRIGIAADGTGWPACGFSAEDCDVIYGNELDYTVTWRGKSDLSAFRGKSVRLRFLMKDADLYSIRFGG